MTSIGGRKSHTSCKTLCNKSRSSGASNTSIDTSHLSITTNGTSSYENTPSPLSFASTSTVEHLPKDGQRILSSTLKSKSFVLLKIQKLILDIFFQKMIIHMDRLNVVHDLINYFIIHK